MVYYTLQLSCVGQHDKKELQHNSVHIDFLYVRLEAFSDLMKTFMAEEQRINMV